MVATDTHMTAEGTRRRAWVGLVLSYVGFISLGLPDTVLGAAWPAMRVELGAALDRAGLALLVTTAGVVISSSSSVTLQRRLGTGGVLVGCTAVASLALLLTGLARSFTMVLTAAFFAGLGGGAIDATLNAYVARNHSARHMSWLHAFWGVGATLAPAVVSFTLRRGASWRVAYAVLAIAELALSLAFFFTRWIWTTPAQPAARMSQGPGAATHPAIGARAASVALFFFESGAEASTGLWAASLLIESRGFSRAGAGAAVASYWAALLVGRIGFGALATRIAPLRLVRVALAFALAGCVGLGAPGLPDAAAVACLALVGLALAPVYPLVMHDTPARFGAATGDKLVSAQVAAAAVGVAVLPWALGFLGRSHGLVWIPRLVAVVVLLTYALTFLRARVRPVR